LIFEPLVQRSKPSMRRNSRLHVCSVPLQRQRQTAAIAGSWVEAAKRRKYNDFLNNFCFQPVTTETTGVYGESTAPILSGLTKKSVDTSGDPWERRCFHQGLSLAVVRRNAGRWQQHFGLCASLNLILICSRCTDQYYCRSLVFFQCIARPVTSLGH